jgi:hypothetical protein
VCEPTFWICDVTNVQQKAGQSSGTSWTYFESPWAEDNCRTFAPLIYISEVLSSGHGSGSRNSDRKAFWTVLNLPVKYRDTVSTEITYVFVYVISC